MTELWKQARQETALPDDIDSIGNMACQPDLWSGLGESIFNRISTYQSSIALASWPGQQLDIDRWISNGLIDFALSTSSSVLDNWMTFLMKPDKLIQVSTYPRETIRWDTDYLFVDYGESFRKKHATSYPDGDTPTKTFGSSIWAKTFY